MRIAGDALGIRDLNDGIMLLSSEDTSSWPSINDPVPTPSSTDVYYDDNMGIFAPVVEKAEVNLLNPFSWFSGGAQNAIDQADQGIAPVDNGGLASSMLQRKARQAEAMKLLRR